MSKKIPPKPKKEILYVRVAAVHLEWLKKRAKQAGLSMSAFTDKVLERAKKQGL